MITTDLVISAVNQIALTDRRGGAPVDLFDDGEEPQIPEEQPGARELAEDVQDSNMVLENVKEMWTERPRKRKGASSKPINKDRFISKMFLRGDSVILVLRNPN